MHLNHKATMKTKIPFLWPTIVCLAIWAAVAFFMTSCQPGNSIPIAIPGITVEGNFADYTYSSKGGLVIKPRTTVIKIRDEK